MWTRTSMRRLKAPSIFRGRTHKPFVVETSNTNPGSSEMSRSRQQILKEIALLSYYFKKEGPAQLETLWIDASACVHLNAVQTKSHLSIPNTKTQRSCLHLRTRMMLLSKFQEPLQQCCKQTATYA